MLNIIDRPEKLWQSCANLAKTPHIIESELNSDIEEHFVLAYGPVAQRNQFQSLLYSAQNQFNVSILPIHDLGLMGEIPWPGKVLCHFHWINGKTGQAKTEDEANSAVTYWENLLRQIKDNGHKILWTVHNVMPHECIWIEQDKKIHQMISDAADALHVMASDSAELTKAYYTLDGEKIFMVSHPTYEGAQPDNISRKDARAKLQIQNDEFIFLSFGAIMEYKGYDRLMKAYDILRSNTTKKIRLIIAGLPTDKILVEKISAWGHGKPDVLLDMTAIPNDYLQVYFNAADIAVCPYYRTMNSGAAMMATTFNVPILGPNSGGFLDLEELGCGMTFNNKDEEALLKSMKDAISVCNSFKNKIPAAKKTLSPDSISRRFFQNAKNMMYTNARI